jgi:hypothetical protein
MNKLENKIYLCHAKKDIRNNYECLAFDSYIQADKYHKKKNNYGTYMNSFMIPISWFIPQYLHQPILHLYISKLIKIQIK